MATEPAEHRRYPTSFHNLFSNEMLTLNVDQQCSDWRDHVFITADSSAHIYMGTRECRSAGDVLFLPRQGPVPPSADVGRVAFDGRSPRLSSGRVWLLGGVPLFLL